MSVNRMSACWRDGDKRRQVKHLIIRVSTWPDMIYRCGESSVRAPVTLVPPGLTNLLKKKLHLLKLAQSVAQGPQLVSNGW
jgi:hypothetical protein